MFTFRKPTEDDVRELLARQQGQPWSYPFVGATQRGSGVFGGMAPTNLTDPVPPKTPDPLLPGWQIDRHRVLLGHGAATFAAACEAIRGWKMFPQQMCQVFWPTTRQEPGEVVAVLYFAKPFLLWMLFPARVVYRIDETTAAASGVRQHPDDSQLLETNEPIGRLTPPARQRFGFAYGTLPEHPERGEERFLVEWNRTDDSVWYDLMAISRPGHWLARIGYPYARYEQAKFRRLSGLAMQEAVRGRESLA